MPTTTRKTTTKKTAPRKAVEGRVLPPGAKVPQDHQPEKLAEETSSNLTVELRGRTWTVSEDALDDFELLDDLNALDQHDDATRLPAVMRRFLGPEQFTEAMALLRDKETKRVSVEAGTTFFWDLMEKLNPNSSGS